MMQVVNVCVPQRFDLYDSYGLIGCQLLRQLAAGGLYVNGYAIGGIDKGNQPDDVRAILLSPRRLVFGGIFLGYPTHYHQHGILAWVPGPRVALTMFESTRMPAGWAEALNAMNAVVTPSAFCRDVFRDGGVRTPIHVAPLGLSPIYKPRQRHSAGGPLTFLAFLDRGARKGGLLALNAFVRAFGESMDYRLILKGRAVKKGGKPTVEILNPNVTLISQDMTEEDLYRLYLDCDVLIAPSMGEGFGMIPREFAATGGVSLATNWSGTAEEIDLWGVPLPYSLVRADWRGARNLEGQELGEWAAVDRDALVERLRDVAAHHADYAERAMRNAPKVAAQYTWDQFGKRVLGIWNEVLNERACGEQSRTTYAGTARQPALHAVSM